MKDFNIYLNYCKITKDFSLINLSNLTTSQFDLLLKESDIDIKYNLAINPNLTTSQINLLLKESDIDIKYYLLKNNLSRKIKIKIMKQVIKENVFK